MTSTTRPGTVVSDSVTSARWTLASRITGLARVVLVGAILGPTFFGNLFQLANQLPWILFEFAVGALLGALLVPPLMRHVINGDIDSIEAVAGKFLGLVLAAFGTLSLGVVVASPLIARIFAIGVGDQEATDQYMSLAIPLVILVAPQLVGYGIVVVTQSVQYAMGQYALPAAASIVENVVLIVTLVIYARTYGLSPSLDQVTTSQILLLGGGSTLGVTLHASLQWWGVKRLGIRLRPMAGWGDPEVRGIIGQLAPSAGTAALNGLRIFVLFVAANTVAGGVVALQFAFSVFNLPVALGCKPVSYSLLPRLSTPEALGNPTRFADAYRRGVGLAALVVIPAAAALASLGYFGGPAVALGEMATAEGRLLLSVVLVGVAGAVIGEGFLQLSTVASYARGDASGLTHAMAVRTGFTVVGVVVGAYLADGIAAIVVIVAAMSVADVLAAAFLHRRIDVVLGETSYVLKRSLLSTTAASVIAFGVVGIGAAVLGATVDTVAVIPRLAMTSGLAVVGFSLFGFLRYRSDGEMAHLVSDLRVGRVGSDAAGVG